MAAKPREPKDTLAQDGLGRLKECRKGKTPWLIDFKECYFFAAPHRQRQIGSEVQPTTARIDDASELQTSIAFVLSGDFVTEIVNTYMPEAQQWCERGPGMFVPAEVYDTKVADQVKKQDKQIFESIKASNLYPELPKAFNPDLAIGTVGLWIDSRRPDLPIECKAVPLREIECALGPDGEIDDRFAIRYTRNRYVRALLPKDTVLPKKVEDDIAKNPGRSTEVRFGFWRLWDRDDDEYWQHVIYVQDELVHRAEIKGEGCCPFLVGRFNPSADWPFGLGVLIQALPELRQCDELEGSLVEAVDRAINPPSTYPDDSFANVEQGIESGMFYPVRPGSEGAVKPLFPPINIDPGTFALDKKEHLLRKLFFVDFPEQRGDTPPTLGQWLDEMARAQRRIGTPGLPFWREVPAKIFTRFKYLLEKAGALQKIEAKNGAAISLRAYNPAQRAAEQQEIATAAQFAQMMAAMFPEEWKLAVDGRITMTKFAEKMRVTGLIEFRDKAQVAGALQQIAQLVKGHVGGAPVAPGSGAPGVTGAPTA